MSHKMELRYGEDEAVESVRPKDAVKVDPDVTRAFGRACRQDPSIQHPEVETYLDIWRKIGMCVDGDGDAAVHLRGLIHAALTFLDRGVMFVVVKPETYLHPKYQLPIGDFFANVVLRKRNPIEQDYTDALF